MFLILAYNDAEDIASRLVYVNMDHVVAILKDTYGSELRVDNGPPIYVRDKPEDIYRLIKNRSDYD